MKPADLIRALDSVPETRLTILELAQQCVDAEGHLDIERLMPLAAEVERAADEARQYIKGTERVRWALENLAGR
ncbi:MAG: hypothetical protein HY669_00660 [Chloroflexi bacterium]|nr:hypothetical protein [Chloroflexota bacterium]